MDDLLGDADEEEPRGHGVGAAILTALGFAVLVLGVMAIVLLIFSALVHPTVGDYCGPFDVCSE